MNESGSIDLGSIDSSYLFNLIDIQYHYLSYVPFPFDQDLNSSVCEGFSTVLKTQISNKPMISLKLHRP